MGAAHVPAGHHFVSLGDLVLYGGVEVVEGLMELRQEPLYVLGAALEHRAVGLVGEVAVKDLVHKLEVPLVADLLDVTPEGGFVLFFRHVLLSSFPYPASLLRRAVEPLMLPSKEAWRIRQALIHRVSDNGSSRKLDCRS